IPQISGAILRNTWPVGINSARELFKAYQNYQLQKGPILYGDSNHTTASNYANNHADFGVILTREGYIDSATYFYINGDPLIPIPQPNIVATEMDGIWTVNPEFASNNISFEIALGIAFTPGNARIPVIWSRLQEN